MQVDRTHKFGEGKKLEDGEGTGEEWEGSISSPPLLSSFSFCPCLFAKLMQERLLRRLAYCFFSVNNNRKLSACVYDDLLKKYHMFPLGIFQHALLLPVLVHHLRYHMCLQTLDDKIGYAFKDRSLLQVHYELQSRVMFT